MSGFVLKNDQHTILSSGGIRNVRDLLRHVSRLSGQDAWLPRNRYCRRNLPRLPERHAVYSAHRKMIVTQRNTSLLMPHLRGALGPTNKGSDVT
jgi:hypothetical protein